MKEYNILALGGTFDHFHKGHKEFLRFAIAKGNKLIIGITSDIYLERSKIKNQRSKIDPYEKRKKQVEDFLRGENYLNKTEILSINDIFGPTLTKEIPFSALIVTQDSQKGALLINEKRKAVGLAALPVLIAPLVTGEDNIAISSTRIRKGEINREGKLFIASEWLNNKLSLPKSLRKTLKAPFGTLLSTDVFDNTFAGDHTITVGDVVTRLANKQGLKQKISIIDFKVERQEKYSRLSDLGFYNKELETVVYNPPGFLYPAIFKTAKTIFSYVEEEQQYIVRIDGEEDLAVLPFILTAPLGFVLYYGQPGEGMVQVVITEEAKEKAYYYVKQFMPPDKQ